MHSITEKCESVTHFDSKYRLTDSQLAPTHSQFHYRTHRILRLYQFVVKSRLRTNYVCSSDYDSTKSFKVRSAVKPKAYETADGESRYFDELQHCESNISKVTFWQTRFYLLTCPLRTYLHLFAQHTTACCRYTTNGMVTGNVLIWKSNLVTSENFALTDDGSHIIVKTAGVRSHGATELPNLTIENVYAL